MKLTPKEIKERYFDKVYNSAHNILCKCGCGQSIKSKDHYARDHEYVNGHNNRKYSDPTEYKRAWNHKHRPERFAYKTKRIHKFKKELIILCGSKCSCCGFPFDGECTCIFDFHHRNPEDKLFNINNCSLGRHGKKKILEEIKKCDLLCANCHRIIHWSR